jgi:uncharacterized cupin superfamily protein
MKGVRGVTPRGGKRSDRAYAQSIHGLSADLTQKDVIFLVIGDRTAGDEVTYPEIDLALRAGPDGVRGLHRKDGTPYPRAARD